MATKTRATEPNDGERDEVLAIVLESAHTRAIRDGYRRWSSGELLSQGVTRTEFERSLRELNADFKKDMKARNLWRFLSS